MAHSPATFRLENRVQLRGTQPLHVPLEIGQDVGVLAVLFLAGAGEVIVPASAHK